MPDFEHEPAERALQRLVGLASAGRARAHGLPAEQVRALGVRRHRRRVLATVAAASVAVAVFAGGVLGVTQEIARTSDPPPAVTPSQTLPREVLLRAEQTVFHERGDFRVDRTVHGETGTFVSVCQRDSLSSLGAVDVWRRDFAFRAGGDTVLRTAAMQFSDADAAGAAYDTLGEWAEHCERAVRARGFDTVHGDGRWYDVAVPQAVARFRSGLTYGPVEGDPYEELHYFDEQGLVLSGDRVMVVSLVSPGQDWNWAFSRRDAEEVGLAMDPMFGTLQAAADNLSR